MADYNAADLRQIRKAARDAKVREAEEALVVANLMSSIAGRSYVYGLLVRCHIFASSFNLSSLAMAYAEGERNIGLQLLGDVMRTAPDQYVQMMREQNDRTIAGNRSPERSGDQSDSNGRDQERVDSSGVGDSDYDPGSDLDGEGELTQREG